MIIKKKHILCTEVSCTHQLLTNIIKNIEKKSYNFNIITLTCKILTSNSLYFSDNKKRVKSDNFKTIILSFFLLMCDEFDDNTLHIDSILLKVHIYFLKLLVIFVS